MPLRLAANGFSHQGLWEAAGEELTAALSASVPHKHCGWLRALVLSPPGSLLSISLLGLAVCGADGGCSQSLPRLLRGCLGPWFPALSSCQLWRFCLGCATSRGVLRGSKFSSHPRSVVCIATEGAAPTTVSRAMPPRCTVGKLAAQPRGAMDSVSVSIWGGLSGGKPRTWRAAGLCVAAVPGRDGVWEGRAPVSFLQAASGLSPLPTIPPDPPGKGLCLSEPLAMELWGAFRSPFSPWLLLLQTVRC